jgi:Pyruvate/2-oxoacid:ferredoxin oxidoreductase gamma subunit
MKEFWSDYAKMCKQSGEFYKEHWKGIIILNVALAGAFAGYMAIATHKDEIKKFFTKKKNVEEVEAN